MTDSPATPAPSNTGGDLSAVEPEPGLVTFFQPFYNLRTERLQGFEALTRRRAAGDDEARPPGSLFASAGTDEELRNVDLRVLDDALRRLALWRKDEQDHDLIVSVNLSPATVSHPDFVDDVLDALERHRIPGDRLLVDITTAGFRRLRSSDDAAMSRIRELQEAEISFCLDAFTSKDVEFLPLAVEASVDIIKLHPCQLTGSLDETATLARAVQEAGLPVVAAGIETDEQLRVVRDLEFEWAQGFLLGEPVDGAATGSQPRTLAAS